MTWFDWAIIAIIVLSFFVGLVRGLVRELFALIGWIAALVLAATFGQTVGGWLPAAMPGGVLRTIAGFVIVFAGVLLASGLLGVVFGGLVRAAGLGAGDRVLGGVFGIARGAFVLVIGALAVGMTPIAKEPFWRNAVLAGPLERFALELKPYLPDALRQRLSFP